MKGDPLPEHDHVLRHCKFTWLDENGAVLPGAFLLEPSHNYISVFWLELTGFARRAEQVEDVRIRIRRCGRHLGGKSKLAILNVGNTIAEIRGTLGRELLFRHEPGEPAEGLDQTLLQFTGSGRTI